MLANEEVAKVSNQAAGCTPSCEQHVIPSPGPDDVEPGEYRIWDTPGLNEGDGGTVPSPKAFDHLVKLVRDHGVNLLIHCIRGPRLKDIFRVNHDLIWGIICQGKVPIVVVITGLEDEHDRDVWWTENREEFERRGMKISGGQVCVVIRRRLSQGDPSLRTDSEEYRKSAAKLWTLIQGNRVRNAWTPKDTAEWSAKVDRTMKKYMDRYNARTRDERMVLPAAAQHTRATLSDWISDWLRLPTHIVAQLVTSVMGSK